MAKKNTVSPNVGLKVRDALEKIARLANDGTYAKKEIAIAAALLKPTPKSLSSLRSWLKLTSIEKSGNSIVVHIQRTDSGKPEESIHTLWTDNSSKFYFMIKVAGKAGKIYIE